MSVASEQHSWTATQVRVLAATGLASSHLHPFVRLLYNDPKSQGRQASGRSRALLVENREDGEDVLCRRQRERDGKYTASWTSANAEVFNVHSVVDWAELQLWNRFDNGFDVFLGKASVSLYQLQQQCSEAMTTGDTPRDSLKTGALWFPLQSSEANGLASNLSLQVECVFTSDAKVLHIRNEILQRRTRKAKKKRRKTQSDEQDPDSGEDVEEESASIADPAFAFTRPFLPVEWSLIASTSTRQLFFHSEVERLADFRDLVLFGDLERELDDDEGLEIHDDHLTAFKACQFAAQYLDHCVDTLSQRLEGYSDDYRALTKTRSQLTRKNKSLKTQRKRLQKEHDDLDLLISTYQRVLEKNGDAKFTDAEQKLPNSPTGTKPPETAAASPPLSPTESLSSKKPVFLKTWEERERERRLEKEISKAQRIEEEKQRLLQRVLERQERDDYEALRAKFNENRTQRAARTIQTFFRSITRALHDERLAEETQAATAVQAAWKRFVHVKEYPRRLEARKQEIEMLRMAQSEREAKQWVAELELKQRAMSPPESIHSIDDGSDDAPSPSASPSKEVVDALVVTWRKLHRVFVLAHRAKEIGYRQLFSEIDLRKDDVLDRAELRLGARSFGVRLDRKITRALVTLIRTKCGVPSKPLLITFEQFMTGFELIQTVTEPADTKLVEESTRPDASFPEDNALDSEDPDAQDGQDTSEEALVLAVRAFRAAVYESATTFLTALGKPSTDYRAFREALAQIFSGFDADRNGQLDVDELVACMSHFNLRLGSDKVALLRELFIGDSASGTVGVAEFVSFVLAHSSSSSEEDELGLLGHRIRGEIMTRVQQAETKTESTEDAVRLVFGAAYTRKNQQDCSIRDFMRALTRQRLGVTPAQLARLVVRLDRNGDRSISFDELLVWLRIRTTPSLDAPIVASPGRTTALQQATNKAKALRILLDKLSPDELSSSATPESKKANLTSLFRHIDRDNSGKINQDELRVFLESQDLNSIVGEEITMQLCGVPTMPEHPAALVAREMMALLDLNANGVTTLKELVTFAQHENSEEGSDPVVIETVRRALKDSESNDPERLILWFSALPGAMRTATTRQGEPDQVKIRVAEFKTALRAKLGGVHSVSIQTIDRVVESLDQDRSGWITTSELSAWAFPPRDLEEILRLVIKSWQAERHRSGGAEFAAGLYTRFDVDGNGSLAVRELLQGFASFGVALTEKEARVLLIAFDVDGDGCWSKAEFLAFVDKLFPAAPFTEESVAPTVTAPEYAEEESQLPAAQTSGGSAYGDDDLLLESGSSNGLSSPAYSDEGGVAVRPVEYSEDFED